MDEVILSCIVPVYNVELYLEECLDSLVRQTVEFDMIILVEDGSSDCSPDICMRYAKKHKNIRFVRQKHGMLGKARNCGMDQLTTGYFLFVDSDDCLEKNTVKRIKAELVKHPCDTLYFDGIVFPKGSSKMFNYSRNIDIGNGFEREMDGQCFFASLYPADYFSSACLAVYNVEFIRRNSIRFPEGILYEDNYFTYVNMMHVQKVNYIHKAFYLRRVRKNSIMTSKIDLLKIQDLWQIINLIYNYMSANRLYGIVHRQYAIDLFQYVLGQYSKLKIREPKLEHEFGKELALIRDGILNDPKVNIGILYKYMETMEFMEAIHIMETPLEEIQLLKSKLTIALKKLLDKCPLGDESLRIGIYGIGKHTDNLITLYERLVGEIRAELLFIETEKCRDNYFGKPVKTVVSLDDREVDLIILSSFKYKRVFISELMKIGICKKK